MSETKLDSISGTIERITYHNPDSGFAVIKLHVSKRKDLVTLTGVVPQVTVGEFIQAQGKWGNNLKYGLQFKAEFIQATAPTTLEGIEKYLGSGLIRGIGPSFAKKLVDAFQEKVLEVIELTPEKLTEIRGIGSAKLELIVKSWVEQKAVREIMIFLQSHGVSTLRATKIFKTYGTNSIKIVSENPYQLARDIRGIGFLSADKIAKNLGIGENSMIRARAGINYALTEALSSGHCALPIKVLLEKSATLLQISEDVLKEALTQELLEGFLVQDTIDNNEVIFLKPYYIYEQYVAQKLIKLAEQRPIWAGIDVEKAINWVESQLSIVLGTSQKDAIGTVVNSKATVITGGPGTGKTTILNSIIKILSIKQIKIKLAAPTGRAAKRLNESTGKEALTIHRLLRFDPNSNSFTYNPLNPLKCDLLIIDESSMIDIALMYHLLRAVPDTAGVIFVGDIDQLPSVGPGKVLKDIIESQKLPTIKLNQIFRQSEKSQIITNAHSINKGYFPKIDNDRKDADFFFIEANTPEEIISKVIKLVRYGIPAHFKLDPIKDIQTLSPMQRGSSGCRSLNIELQKVLNPLAAEGIERFGQMFAVNDKVMQTENNYDKEVYNGDVGFIESIDREENKLSINFDNRIVSYGFDELDELTIAYAITIHKSQGSEYNTVVIPMSTQHFPMLQKNLLYTAVTRGKNLVFLVGQKQAIAIAVKNNRENLRYSKLRELLA